MEKFLESVAVRYLRLSSDHRGTTLIFPNKRTSLFMRRYFKRNAQGPVFMPRMITIGSFFSKLSDNLPEADRLEQLFTLYDSYCEAELQVGQTPRSFDRFRFWGEMMLDDFEDIDRQLVDPDSIFKNIAGLQEIKTDYLTDEQRDVARELWGYDPRERYESFWRHYARKDGEDVVYDGFRSLTELLQSIYTGFHTMLAEKGLTTRGRLARNAASRISGALETEGVLPEKFGIVGFGVLSEAEKKVFDELRKTGRAEFFWDYPTLLGRDLPPNLKKGHNALEKYISKLLKQFKMPTDYVPARLTQSPGVEVISVPSNTLQTKVAGNIVESLRNAGFINSSRADDTVLVLPDPALLVPMLYSLPPKLGTVNVTMGLPLRNTPFATFLSAIITTHLNGRFDGTDYVYLTENVARILTHPSMSFLAPGEASSLRRYLESHPRFLTPLAVIEKYSPTLNFIFRPIENDETAEAAENYLTGLIDGMTSLIEKNVKPASVKHDAHELRTLTAIRGAVTRIITLLKEHREITPDLEASSMTFFRMVEKILNREVMNLSGSPLRGVQMMGVLETRSLDFNNVIMLSMNEKIFPPKHFIRSMVPGALRAAYGMTTVEQREMEYSWIFANILSRSKRVYLLYNASAEDEGAGGMSRYLYQAEHIYTHLKARHITVGSSGKLSSSPKIVIDKTSPSVKAELNRLRAGGDLNISASALKNYMKCPLKFYLSNVRKVSETKEPTPSIDAAAQGTIAHAVLENLFKIYVVELNSGWVTSDLNIPVDVIKKEVVNQFDANYYFGRFKGNVDLMPGEARMLVDILTKRIARIIELEAQRAPFKFVGAEVTPKTAEHPDKAFDWKINDDLTIRFTYSVDRIDELNDGTLRFIDYKTGLDLLQGGSLDRIFHKGENDEGANDAIFQLLTYAHAYSDFNRIDTPVRIEITKVFNPEKSIGHLLSLKEDTADGKSKRVEITSHKAPEVVEFRQKLQELIAEIFSPEVPFVQTDNAESCKFCQFVNICHRVIPEDKY